MKNIIVKNTNCDWDNDGIIGCDDNTVIILYFKNKNWRAYGSSDFKSQKDVDETIEEVMHEANVTADKIRFVKPLSSTFKEVTLKQALATQLNKKKAAAKKKIQDLKKKFNL